MHVVMCNISNSMLWNVLTPAVCHSWYMTPKVTLGRSDTASAGQPKMKEKSPELPLQYIHSITL